MYVAELAHTSIRGTLGTFFQMQITVGLLIEYVLGESLDHYLYTKREKPEKILILTLVIIKKK